MIGNNKYVELITITNNTFKLGANFSNWQADGGIWNVNNNMIKELSGVGHSKYLSDINYLNEIFSVEFIPKIEDGSIGVLFGYNDDRHFLLDWDYNDGIKLLHAVNDITVNEIKLSDSIVNINFDNNGWNVEGNYKFIIAYNRMKLRISLSGESYDDILYDFVSSDIGLQYFPKGKFGFSAINHPGIKFTSMLRGDSFDNLELQRYLFDRSLYSELNPVIMMNARNYSHNNYKFYIYDGNNLKNVGNFVDIMTCFVHGPSVVAVHNDVSDSEIQLVNIINNSSILPMRI